MECFLCILILLLCCWNARPAGAATRHYTLTLHETSQAPDGFERKVYLVNGQHLGPLIEADQGDTLIVRVYNNLTVENTIHWHGLFQSGTPQMDGAPSVSQYPIPAGGNFTYTMHLTDQYGFYWYHSHMRAYYNDGIRGPLLIHPPPSLRRSYEDLARNEEENAILREVEKEASPVLLADWYHDLSDVVLQRYFTTGVYPLCVNSLLANGQGKVRCLPASDLTRGPNLGLDQYPQRVDQATAMTTPVAMRHPSASSTPMPKWRRKRSMNSDSGGMHVDSDMTTLNALGCEPPSTFNPGYNISSLPPVTCDGTSSSLLTIPGDCSKGWLTLHFVNAAAATKMHISLDAHSMWVFAADGLDVKLQNVKVLPIAIGERYSVMIKLDQKPGQYLLRYASYPTGDMQQVVEDLAVITYQGACSESMVDHDSRSIWMLLNGTAKANVSQLDSSLLAPFVPKPPPQSPAAVTKDLVINQSEPTVWLMNKVPYQASKVPIIYGNQSDGWTAPTTLHMPFNSTIDFVLSISNDSMDMMGHPMHMHGHKFWILGSGHGSFPYDSVLQAPSSMINLKDPPYRDLVELPRSGWAVIRYISDNPGAWFFHCHIQWHILSGMAVVLVEGEKELTEIMSLSSVGD